MTTERPEWETLAECRAAIDAIDDDLLSLLARRQAVVEKVKVIKARDGLAAAQPSRVAEVLDRVRAGADRRGVHPDLAADIWRVMVDHFIAEEEAVLGKGGRNI
ncbi:chorismate mutase [Jannaschia aquimarina]|uniref:chorismate mutase n=1 Tax=Jannaschia aquimarina TaxID=935700 RepID=A0A0D1EC76_9RHOB|nr:chorismate mutase [Jannaschia aquimarina]KIT15304.1 T-protein [Jannaschia aquimarina]SNS50828.1 chorismate mutase [Jannaschia aquimarina]